MDFWIIMLIAVGFIYFINTANKKAIQNQQKKNQEHTSAAGQANNSPHNAGTHKQIEVLKSLKGFNPKQIMISKSDFYVFAADEKAGKIAFVCDDLKAYMIPFGDILSYEVISENADYKDSQALGIHPYVAIDIKTTNNKTTTLECFDINHLTTRQNNPIYNELKIKMIYAEEMTVVKQICQWLDFILRENEKAKKRPPQTTVEPKQQESKPQQPVTPQPKAVPQPAVCEPVIEQKQEEQASYAKEAPADIAPSNTDIPKPSLPNEQEWDLEEEMKRRASQKEEITDKIKVSVDQVETLSRGAMVDLELISILSDARMRGETEVYLPTNKWAEIQKNILLERDEIKQMADFQSSDISYTSIEYQPLKNDEPAQSDEGEDNKEQ
ncbi:hypothetical protein M2132_001661 [Dysgonomonas sp. PH5-45]|uniref:hypothetical protein n=1 Tax=unclassified Dysgonomonas TaxID=2630389 RepID=UPI0024736613|nr:MULTISPECIES: hypothetical protein [unclassified Dysgonomonas]MDH6355320.1 hypothetical protein [Dysgonomonas sp. PH5-45]MDH6388218.1 hypothetical protein [Dysgonomonas sp. PH5-37]